MLEFTSIIEGIESPRIYTYKITFKDMPYYYFGVHKEKRFNEEYLGTPRTNKWCWDLYEVEKQILEVFPNTEEGWIDALNVERRLIRPVFNSDPYCLNANCGGFVSLEVRKKTAKKTYQEGKGLGSLTKEQLSELGRKTSTQKWKCLVTGKISNSGGLSTYQKAKGIDTSKRVRIS